MASYQTRHRDPLLDSETQAALERRSRELLGIVLIIVGLLGAMICFSYSPTDPSWISASDAPVENWLGMFGAATAAPLMMIVGLGIWALPLVLIGWGARFVMHLGSERAVGRIIYVPVVIAAASLYAAGLPRGTGWPANFGMGGMFGDTVSGMALMILPVGPAVGIKLMSLVLGLVTAALMAFALGFTRPELRNGARFVLMGTVMIYDLLLRAAGQGTAKAAQAATAARGTIAARVQDRAAARATQAVTLSHGAEPPVAAPRAAPRAQMPAIPHDPNRKMPPIIRADGSIAPQPAAVPDATSASPRKMPGIGGLLRRAAPVPELIETDVFDHDIDAPTDDRVRSRITDAIKARVMPAALPDPHPVTGVRIEPALTAGKRPRPLILPSVPPLTARAVPDTGAGGAHDWDDAAEVLMDDDGGFDAAEPLRMPYDAATAERDDDDMADDMAMTSTTS